MFLMISVRPCLNSQQEDPLTVYSVLTSDYAVLLAEEYGRNPIVNDEMAFNIYPS